MLNSKRISPQSSTQLPRNSENNKHTCAFCGKIIEHYEPRKKYCSRKCLERQKGLRKRAQGKWNRNTIERSAIVIRDGSPLAMAVSSAKKYHDGGTWTYKI